MKGYVNYDLLCIAAYSVIGSYGVNRCKDASETTPEEFWETMDLCGHDKPDKDEFVKKVEEELQKNVILKLREVRNRLLEECDWTQIKDVVLEEADEWTAYRKALRDLPTTAKPVLVDGRMKIDYPTKPGEPIVVEEKPEEHVVVEEKPEEPVVVQEKPEEHVVVGEKIE